MRILHVINGVDPHDGGPSHAIRAIVSHQAAAGHDVSLLATNVQSNRSLKRPEAYRQAIREETAFHDCEVKLVEAWCHRRPWSHFAISPAAKHWLRQRFADPLRAPEVVHIHGVFSHIGLLAAAESRRHGVPYVIRPCGILNAHCFNSGRAWLKRMFVRMFLRRQLQATAFLHATSQSEADELVRFAPRDRIRTLPLGVDVQSSADASSVERFLAWHPRLHGKRIVLFLGRIAPKKRPELLVDAIARLRNAMPDVALLLVGQDDGGLAAVNVAIERHHLADSIVHVGFLAGEDKAAAFAVASLFALPSLDENFGVAVVEAMAAGLPVLVTPGVAAANYVTASGGGLVVIGTAEAIAEGMQRILTAGRNEMGRAGQNYIERHLSWPAALARLDGAYSELVQERAGTHCPRFATADLALARIEKSLK